MHSPRRRGLPPVCRVLRRRHDRSLWSTRDCRHACAGRNRAHGGVYLHCAAVEWTAIRPLGKENTKGPGGAERGNHQPG